MRSTPVRTNTGVVLGADLALSEVDLPVHTVVVPGPIPGLLDGFPTALVAEVRRLGDAAHRVASICTGAFLLAEAGLLAGRQATTHWSMCAELTARFPGVRVQPDAIYVRDDNVVTSAGVTAGIDLALALVEDDHGPEVARTVARHLVVFLRNHSLRSFLFARAAAEQRGSRAGKDYDTELVFLICVLHDMGLTDAGNTDQRFEVAGADLAARFLEEHGVTDRRVDTVWEAIALHTSQHLHESPVFQRRRPAEIAVAQTGIGIDVTGPDSPGQLPPGFADRVHAQYPRLGGSRALTDTILEQTIANPLKAPPMTLPGEILHQRRPSLPYLTWDMILDANAWAD